MIPRLPPEDAIEPLYREFLDELGAGPFSGDIRTDFASRIVLATDNSVHQIVPQAILFPRTRSDVQAVGRLANQHRFHRIRFAPRGGGTGTNGGSLGTGVCVDLSRYMNRILDLDVEAKRLRVEPGVTLDQVNHFLAAHGLFFAPHVAPSDRATLGGMVSTDASGIGSRVYGRTSNHVESIGVVLADGSYWRSQPLRSDDATTELPERIAAAAALVAKITRTHAGEIQTRFPTHDRFLTGYDLAHAARDDEINLTAILCGSEGTLGFVVDVELQLTARPACTELTALFYASFDDALADAQALVDLDPTAIETIDETILSLARQDPVWRRVASCVESAGAGQARAMNLVEVSGNDAGEVSRRMTEVDAMAARGVALGSHRAARRDDAEALWELRKKGVGLLGAMAGRRQPVAFVEDCALPPSELPAFVREMREILASENLDYGMYGHVDVGCLHVRPALDLRDPADERRLRDISDRVFELVRAHGGVFWGEHGKGLRSHYNPQVFGPVLYEDLCRIKRAFDPHDQMNPGKVATASPNASLAPIGGDLRGTRDRDIAASVERRIAATVACNGNGACFSLSTGQTMCPSMKERGDRVHSPKGRAALLREWARGLSRLGWDGTEPYAAARLRNAIDPQRWSRFFAGAPDFSHQVYDALDGCLACKACVGQCPIHVDIPSYKAEFLYEYHQRYPRSAEDVLIARLESALPHLAPHAGALNFLLQSRFAEWLSGKVFGLTSLPRLASRPADAILRERGALILDGNDFGEGEAEVALLLDAFSNFLAPQVALSAYETMRQTGRTVAVLPYRPSGKSFHVKGYLAEARRLAEDNSRALAPLAASGVEVFCVDPAIALLFRQEYPALLGKTAAARVFLPQEILAASPDRLPPAGGSGSYVLLAHCTESTTLASAGDDWKRVFAAAGLRLETRRVGCCGMAGAYGHQARHQEASRRIFNLSWAQPIKDLSPSRILVTGHSCRTQVERLAGFSPRHPLQVLEERWASSAPDPVETL